MADLPAPPPNLLDDLADLRAAVARIEAALTVPRTQADAHPRAAKTICEEVTPVTTTITETLTEGAGAVAETLPTPAPKHGRQGGYLAKKCPELYAKDNMPLTYPVELKLPYSAFALSLMNSGNEFEDHIGARLAAEADDSVVVLSEARTPEGERTVEGKQAKERDTWEAYLNPKVNFIFNARMGGHFEELVSAHFGRPITDEDRVSEPDAIELGPVMANGVRAMRFVDVKWHKTAAGKSVAAKTYPASPLSAPFFGEPDTIDLFGSLNSDDWMQLAHYYRHAESLGLADDDHSYWGAVIGKEEVLVWSRLDRATFMAEDPRTGRRRKQTPLELYDRGFAYGLDVVDNALARDLDPSIPAVTYPEWKDDCKECPWKDVCVQELETHGDGGHITLLPGITPAKAKPFYTAGINDAGALARLDPHGVVADVKELAPFVYQARVSKAQKVFRAPGVTYVNLPRAAIEFDFDYEAHTDGGVYMRGVRATGRRKKPNGDYRSRVEMHTFDDYTGTEAGELGVFVEFWSYLQSMVSLAKARHYSIRMYHYTGYERTQDLRLAEKYAGQPGVPTVQQVEDFYASDLVVDMYPVLSKDLIWPTKSHSIKSLARNVGFEWQGDSVGGDLSMVWYKLACDDPDPAVRAENIEMLQVYNADDVAAQVFLRNWTSQMADDPRTPGNRLPSVETLRPPIKPRALAMTA